MSYEIEDKVLEIVHWYNMFGAEYKGVNAAQIALSDPGIIVLVWENGSKDGVYLWDDGLELETSTEDDCMYKIANSFDEFVGKLYLWDPED